MNWLSKRTPDDTVETFKDLAAVAERLNRWRLVAGYIERLDDVRLGIHGIGPAEAAAIISMQFSAVTQARIDEIITLFSHK